MILLQCDRITKSFGAETILQDIKMEIKSGERIALVGRNGSGKSTLLKIMTGELSYDSGTIHMPKSQTVGFLAQNSGLDSERSIWAEMVSVFTELRALESDVRDLEAKMADPRVYENDHTYERIAKEYEDKLDRFQLSGGYRYEADIRSVLTGLNFSHLNYNLPISNLSGGQKTRLALGKLLLTNPDLLILDEPTNHLDIQTMTWLENYLSAYKGAVLIVSHDRFFLDKIVNKIYEVTHQKLKLYHGNYSAFLEQKAKDFDQEQKAYEKQQAEIAQLETFVQKNIARASTTKRAQSRRKQLEKMDRLDAPKGDAKSASIAFDIAEKSGADVLTTEGVTFSYPDAAPLFESVSLKVTRGERLAIIGSNGTGKTTLLKILGGHLQASEGSVSYGSKVSIGYYDQEQANLHPRKTVLDELWDEYPHIVEKEIRTVLGRFLFSGEDVMKLVHSLSGGEKSRLVLAKLMMQKANVLLFDEPTNHLDLDSKEVLEQALMDYPGTMIFISHDRYFLNRLTSRTLVFANNQLHEYLGNYNYYLEKKAEEDERKELQEESASSAGSNPKESTQTDKSLFQQEKENKKEARKRQREIEMIEDDIEKLESETATFQSTMLDPDVYNDYEQANEIQQKIAENEQRLEALLEKWEMIQTK